MPLDLNGFAVSSCGVHIPPKGIPSANVVLVDNPASLTEGSPVLLHVGDATFSGTLRPGGTFGASTYWTVIGAAGAWDRPVLPRSYYDTGGVKLSTLCDDLAQELGGIVLDPVKLTPVAAEIRLNVDDRTIGVPYTRLGGTAAEVLDSLSRPFGATIDAPGQWYAALDGQTHVGPRPVASVTASPGLTVTAYDPSMKLATVRVSDEAIASLLPGVTLTAPGLPSPLLIGAVVIRASEGNLELDLHGEKDIPDLLAALVAALRAPDRYARLTPMLVAQVQDVAASVAPLTGTSLPSQQPDASQALLVPASAMLTQIPGVPGMSAVLQVGATVLVAWPSADPANPAIVGYAPGMLPASVQFDASSKIQAGATTHALVRLDLLTAILTTISADLVALGRLALTIPSNLGTSKFEAE